jgi:2,3-bisphosphoglycerate-independent phosphoglycerate mutase
MTLQSTEPSHAPKRVLLVPDGMADEPVAALGGRTPLEAAATLAMDELAASGTMGMVQTVPAGLPAGSDVANLAALGYDPAAVYTGRAPLEAASIGVELAPGDVAYRCNLVTLVDGVMSDFTADHIPNNQAARVMALLDERLGRGAGDPFEFHAGVSYRNLLVWRGGSADAVTTPPHDKLDCTAAEWLPRGGAAAPALRDLMARARALVAGAATAATDIWLWGQGTAPRLPALRELRGLDGAVVAAVDLVRGIGRCAGMEVLDVPGATGDLDTDYGAKARAALEALARHDFVFVHVEAPDEAGHMGDVAAKVRAIERVDAEVLRPLLASRLRPCVLVLPDHHTPLRLRTHVDWPVPFVFGRAGAPQARPPAAPLTPGGFCERTAASGDFVATGAALMDRFLAAANVAR